MDKKIVQFNLINNAKDSLKHAIGHLTTGGGPKPEDLKYAIRDVAHVIELLLKERLNRIHPAFVYQNVDKFKALDAKTVDTETAITRLLTLANVVLNKAALNTIKACRRVRNDIEHYEFEFDLKEAQGIIGRMLSFIFDFSRQYLSLDLEVEFRKDDSWKGLIDIYEFWEAHAATLEKQLLEQNIPYCECPSCGAATFDLGKSKCLLCEHTDEQIECEACGETIWVSESEMFGGMDGDEDSGVYEYEITVCQECIAREHEYLDVYE